MSWGVDSPNEYKLNFKQVPLILVLINCFLSSILFPFFMNKTIIPHSSVALRFRECMACAHVLFFFPGTLVESSQAWIQAPQAGRLTEHSMQATTLKLHFVTSYPEPLRCFPLLLPWLGWQETLQCCGFWASVWVEMPSLSTSSIWLGRIFSSSALTSCFS